MKNNWNTFFLVSAVLLLAAAPLFAHHGEATYDISTEIMVMGRVTQFDFSNPHTQIYFEIVDSKGKAQEWIGEAGSPNMLSRQGWNKDSLKAGDEVTISGHPAKKGANAILLEKVVLADGRELAPQAR